MFYQSRQIKHKKNISSNFLMQSCPSFDMFSNLTFVLQFLINKFSNTDRRVNTACVLPYQGELFIQLYFICTSTHLYSTFKSLTITGKHLSRNWCLARLCFVVTLTPQVRHSNFLPLCSHLKCSCNCPLMVVAYPQKSHLYFFSCL